jgi:hypothetical protein
LAENDYTVCWSSCILLVTCKGQVLRPTVATVGHFVSNRYIHIPSAAQLRNLPLPESAIYRIARLAIKMQV